VNYRVIYAPSFGDDIRQHIQYLRDERVSDHLIERWYGGLFDLIDSLAEWPRRYPRDHARSQSTNREIRKLNFGDYIIRFQIDDKRGHVNVIAFVHGAGDRNR
jgi:mRNA-degrading endonuclease RelE of RelBE toxin-antitoxin system